MNFLVVRNQFLCFFKDLLLIFHICFLLLNFKPYYDCEKDSPTRLILGTHPCDLCA